jgi:protein Tex
MLLEGTVTNVAAFGAFVDIGVHQDGLVHVSQLADRFVKDPHEVVKAGDVVKVRVVEVDAARKRIGLTMKSQSGEARETAQERRGAPAKGQPVRGAMSSAPKVRDAGGGGGNAFADALKGRFPR